MPPIGITLAAIAVAVSVPILLYSVGARTATGIFARRAGRGEGQPNVDGFLLHGSAGERVVLPASLAITTLTRRLGGKNIVLVARLSPPSTRP